MSFFRPIRIVTHSGSFHADDVFAVATLLLLLEKRKAGRVKVVRSREEADFAKGDYVVDVGGVYDVEKGRFDHHQPGGAAQHEQGIPKASFGLVWGTYGAEICGSVTVATAVNQSLVMPVDAIDNGVEISTQIFADVNPFTISRAVSSFLPTWKEMDIDTGSKKNAKEVLGIFMKVVAMAKKVLERQIRHSQDAEEGRVLVERAYQESADKRVIVLDNVYPWGEALAAHPEPVYVIYPSSGKKWHVKGVRDNPSSFKVRKDFPAEWGGKKDAELVALTGVADAVFCHKNLFLVGAGSKDGARALAALALK